jgi:hypothetical protein
MTMVRKLHHDHPVIPDSLVVEVPDGIFQWMEPKDLQFDDMTFRINDGSGRGLGGARVVSADGTVSTFGDDLPPEPLRAMLTASGGEKVEN